MESKKSKLFYNDFRFWMVIISLTLLLWLSIQNYPGS